MEPTRINGPRGLGEELYAKQPGSVLLTTEAQAHLSLLRSTVEEELAFPLEQRGIAPTEMSSLIARIAQGLELEPLLAKNPASLSGGQTRRLALALVAIIAYADRSDTSTLIVEDVYEGLDHHTRDMVRLFLHSLPFPVIEITTVEEDAPSQWDPPAPITPRGDNIDIAQLSACRGYRPRRLWFRGHEPEFTIGPIDLSFPRGSVLWLQGHNGSGKTTLLRSLIGLDTYYHSQYPYSMGMMVQNSLDQLIDPSIEQALGRPACIALIAQQDPQTHPLDLSPALQRLLQLEIATVNDPELLLADEPDVHLGAATAPAFHARLAQYLAGGGSAIISCHAEDFMHDIARYATVHSYSLEH